MTHFACGILFCYNEEHILAHTFEYYLSQGIDLIIFDNGSTDSSPAIIDSFREQRKTGYGIIHDVRQIETDGYEWQKILKTACAYMHEHLSHYEWILLIDADNFYHSPVQGMPLLEFVSIAGRNGYNILDGRLQAFYPTEKDDPSIESPIQRLKYFAPAKDSFLDPQQVDQHKIFRYHPSIDFYTSYGHVCSRHGAKKFPVRFLLRHYPWISYEHGAKKIFAERKLRYTERKINPGLYPAYNDLLPVASDLIKDAKTLLLLDRNTQEMPPPTFFFLLKIHMLLYKVSSFWQKLKNAWWSAELPELIRRFFDLLHYDRPYALKAVVHFFNWRLFRNNLPPLQKQSKNFHTITRGEIVAQKPHVVYLPQTYHFLVTDRCNARCIFCNQDFGAASGNNLTLEKFKTIFSNIVTDGRTGFVFNGGGDPLLNEDLFEIIKLVNKQSPWVKVWFRTNGILIGKYMDQIISSHLDHIEISVHGATRESQNAIFQIKNKKDVYLQIAELNAALENRCRSLRKVFCVVVSQLNIDEVPKIIEKAAELKVGEVTVSFTRYCGSEENKNNPWRIADPKDSLYWAQDRYNLVMERSIKLAKKLKVSLSYDPLFGKKYKPKPCFQPWQLIVIDWNGEIYPCMGGEVWFNERVKTGQYHFGNLLRLHLVEIWNNNDYLKVRRTCNQRRGERWVPECQNCHNTVWFRGSDVKEGHFLKSSYDPVRQQVRLEIPTT